MTGSRATARGGGKFPLDWIHDRLAYVSFIVQPSSKPPLSAIGLLRAVVGAVWVFHGLWSKLLGGIPRHREIVARVVGEEWADLVLLVVAVGEILLGAWVWSGRWRWGCALVQMCALASMNVHELVYARDLLLAPLPMVLANVLLVVAAWWLARRGQ